MHVFMNQKCYLVFSLHVFCILLSTIHLTSSELGHSNIMLIESLFSRGEGGILQSSRNRPFSLVQIHKLKFPIYSSLI